MGKGLAWKLPHALREWEIIMPRIDRLGMEYGKDFTVEQMKASKPKKLMMMKCLRCGFVWRSNKEYYCTKRGKIWCPKCKNRDKIGETIQVLARITKRGFSKLERYLKMC